MMITVAAGGEAVHVALTVTSTQVGVDLGLTPVGLSFSYTDLVPGLLPTVGSHTRFFDSGGGWGVAKAAYTAQVAKGLPRGRYPVFSAKRHDTAAFNDLLTTQASDQTIGVAFYHEPEDDWKKNNPTEASWQSTVTAVRADIDAHPNRANVRLIFIGMAYQEVDVKTAPFDMVDAIGGLHRPDGSNLFDLVAWDVYDDPWRPATWTPAAAIGPLVTQAAQLGLPWAVTELGVQTSTKTVDTEALAAARLQAALDYCKSNGAQWVNYWWGNGWQLPVTSARLAVLAAALTN